MCWESINFEVFCFNHVCCSIIIGVSVSRLLSLNLCFPRISQPHAPPFAPPAARCAAVGCGPSDRSLGGRGGASHRGWAKKLRCWAWCFRSGPGLLRSITSRPREVSSVGLTGVGARTRQRKGGEMGISFGRRVVGMETNDGSFRVDCHTAIPKD